VSQSVEHEHPQAIEFLRRDCTNVNDYFKRQGFDTCTTMHPIGSLQLAGLTTMTVRELFDFCTSETLADDQVEQHLLDLMSHVNERSDDQVLHRLRNADGFERFVCASDRSDSRGCVHGFVHPSQVGRDPNAHIRAGPREYSERPGAKQCKTTHTAHRS
jgi:hypothetical protein